jgi:thioredoxin-related protein
MKKLTLLLLVSILLFSFTIGGEKNEAISLGAEAPKTDLKMMDISGKEVSLSEIKKENGLLVIFSCNTCPFVINWEDRYLGLADICEQNKIGMVLVNSNEAKRKGDDSLEEMKKHASEKNYNCYYTVDENSALADAFGAKTTPHVFLFDREFKLVFRGAIDDTEGKKGKQPKDHYLINAMVNMTTGKSIVPSDTKAVGCSIKRVKAADCK